MAETFKLAAVNRERAKKSARSARQNKQIPGILYGHGVESTPIAVDYSEFLKLFRKTGQSSVIELLLEGKSYSILIHGYDQDPVQDNFIHIDLISLNMKETTVAHVPLEFIGESEAVKTLGGIFTNNTDALEIRCLPKDIPHEIKVDISSMENLHDSISLKDLNLPETLEVLHLDEDVMICSVAVASQSKTSSDEEESEEESKEEASE